MAMELWRMNQRNIINRLMLQLFLRKDAVILFKMFNKDLKNIKEVKANLMSQKHFFRLKILSIYLRINSKELIRMNRLI
jgi:hypothetical protein